MRNKSYLKSPGLLDLLEVDEGEGRRHHHQARDKQPEGHCPIEIDFETIMIIYILEVSTGHELPVPVKYSPAHLQMPWPRLLFLDCLHDSILNVLLRNIVILQSSFECCYHSLIVVFVSQFGIMDSNLDDSLHCLPVFMPQ